MPRERWPPGYPGQFSRWTRRRRGSTVDLDRPWGILRVSDHLETFGLILWDCQTETECSFRFKTLRKYVVRCGRRVMRMWEFLYCELKSRTRGASTGFPPGPRSIWIA